MVKRLAGYYSYNYKFSSAGLNEIISRQKCDPLADGDRAYFFEMRTEFFILWRKPEEEEESVAKTKEEAVLYARDIIGTERYDVSPVHVDGGASSLEFHLSARLKEYWLSPDEIDLFCDDAIAFAEPIAAQRASTTHIPIVVHLDIFTVQQEGESIEAIADRAIMPHKLFPLYLWPAQSAVRRPLACELMGFLLGLPRTRVDNVESCKALMPGCSICLRGGPHIGDQITKLTTCGCAFHYHCIVLRLEKNNRCPECDSQAYDCSLLKGLEYEYLFDEI